MEPGTRVGQYEIIEEIGLGAMGVVFKARDTELYDRTVAVKVLSERLSKNRKARKRFEQEVGVASAMVHPNLVTIFRQGEYRGSPFFAMEYVRGRTLDHYIRDRSSLALAERLDVARQICRALHHVHSRALVHRDVKPGNIMIVSGDGEHYVKLMDFGIVHVETSELTRAHTQPGTFTYMSPEQLGNRAIDSRSDLFSLGIVLHELFTGAHPFEADTEALIIDRILHEEPTSPDRGAERISTDLGAVLSQLLEKDPVRRPPSAGETAERLHRILVREENLEAGTDPRLRDLSDQIRRMIRDPAPSARPEDGSTTVSPKLEQVESLLDAGDADGARVFVASVAANDCVETWAGPMLEFLNRLHQDGIPYGEIRSSLRHAREALRADDFEVAGRHCAEARALWPDGVEWRKTAREIDRRRVGRVLELLAEARLRQREAESRDLSPEDSRERVAMALDLLERAAEIGGEQEVISLFLGQAREVESQVRRRQRRRLHRLLRLAAGREEEAEFLSGRWPDQAEESAARYGEALDVFVQVHREDPSDVEASRGVARVRSVLESLESRFTRHRETVERLAGIRRRLDDLEALAEQEGDRVSLKGCRDLLEQVMSELNAIFVQGQPGERARSIRDDCEDLLVRVEREIRRVQRGDELVARYLREGRELQDVALARIKEGNPEALDGAVESCRRAEELYRLVLAIRDNHDEAAEALEMIATLEEHATSERARLGS